MTAQLDVLTEGYVGDRVAGTVVAIRDGDVVAVVDPGMVADRGRIIGPLADLGIAPDEVTDVVFSHHHPDHTVNAALFQRARIHDFQATYVDDQWIDREFEDGVARLSASVGLLLTPGHTPQDLTTVVETDDGLVVCTHLWWSVDGPLVDPYAEDAGVLQASRELVLELGPALIVPGHGAPFAPHDRLLGHE
jgi:glyoxylase-like metal-dependent hydrolase (beta-lactamase superfamily II)